MKIETKKLTPLYDQYSNQENRLTHAFSTLAGSEKIFRQFLSSLLELRKAWGVESLKISTQKRPFSQEDIDLKKVDSVPDGWIVENQGELVFLIRS